MFKDLYSWANISINLDSIPSMATTLDPISPTVVCGHVGAVGGVDDPESQRQDSKAILGSMSSSDAKEALEGRV